MSWLEELQWMQENPAFEERPATIHDFVWSEKYLNIGKRVRPGVMKLLEDIFGDVVSGKRLSQYQRCMFTGAIGVGKTTFASIAIPYMAHWVLCLKDPQEFYELLPGSRIAFMQMSTTRDQARQVVFGDIIARIENCRWFREKYPHDPNWKTQIRWEKKNVWILPGDSKETTFEGYNILGGILDEADSHTITKDKDYAEVGYDTINGRIQSRFVDNSPESVGGNKGLLIVVGQMKKQNGFAHKIYKQLLDDEHALVERMTIWESFGWDKYMNSNGTRNSFFYDVRTRQFVQDWLGPQIVDDKNVIEIPRIYWAQFKSAPEKSLKDLAGIPPSAEDPFISQPHKIEVAQEKWKQMYDNQVAVTDSCVNPTLNEWVGTGKWTDSRKRVAHIDIAYSAEGDAAGIVIGHVDSLVENDQGELKPFIVIDVIIRLKAPAGGEVQISDLRRFIYELVARGVRIYKVTLDGFQSTDTMQQFRKKRIRADLQSMDKTKLGYEDMREALNEERIAIPEYITQKAPGSTEYVNIVYVELTDLTDTGLKIDHSKTGSKDVADGIASVSMSLMQDNTYRKGVLSNSSPTSGRSAEEAMKDLLGRFDRTMSSSIGQQSSTGMPSVSELKGLRPDVLQVPDRLRPKD